MDINQLSDNITAWLQTVLTPDKVQSVQDFIADNINRVAHHKFDLYLGYLGLTKENFINALYSPMPAMWNDTTGKALEQFLKGMGL